MTSFSTAIVRALDISWGGWEIEDTSTTQRAVFTVNGPVGERTNRLSAAAYFTHKFFDGNGSATDFQFVLAGLEFKDTDWNDQDVWTVDFDKARKTGGEVV